MLIRESVEQMHSIELGYVSVISGILVYLHTSTVYMPTVSPGTV